MSADAPYRDDRARAEARRDQALRGWSEELAALGGEAERVVVARWARSATAAVVAFGYAVLGLVWVVAAEAVGTDAGLLAWTLPALLGALASILARRLARTRLERRLRRVATPTHDPVADLDRLEAHPPARLLGALARRAEPWSSLATMVLAGLTLALTSSTLTLAFTLVPLPPLGVPAYFIGMLAVKTAWIQPVLVAYAALAAWRWARRDAAAIEASPILTGCLAVAAAGGCVLPSLRLLGVGGAGQLVLALLSQTLLVLLGQARLRRRLVAERALLAAQERAR